MKTKLQIHRIPEHTDEWYEFRKSGIGGSETGSVLGLNPYETATRLFYEKIGFIEHQTEDTQFMFWGREHEDKIAEIWQYYDGTESGYIENKKNNKIIRKCRNVNGIVVNPDFPWLFASLDRLINKEGGVNFITGEPLTEESILECKTLSYWGSSAWEDGIPIYFLTQVQTYMLIFECNYAEIAILTDGNRFKVEYIQRDDTLCKQIADITKRWWYERVIPAKKAKQERDTLELEGNMEAVEERDNIIQQLEPEPDETQAYRDFQSEKFLKERESIEGTIEQFDLCKKDEMLKHVSNRIKKERDLVKNILVKHVTDAGAEMIDFDSLGKFTYSEKKGSKSRTALISIKEKPYDERIEEEFSKIDTKY